MLSSGDKLGQYEILRCIGAGGMGEVFRARDSRLHRDVAIKVLPAGMADNPDRLARFQREARAVAALNHPHIVTIYSVEHTDGIHFLTMELVEGQALDLLICADGLALEKIVNIAMELADALGAAHDKGIVHRDLKPANVMVTQDGRVKVLDFGLAKEVGRGDADEATRTSLGNTQAGVVMGTPAYMSPEQISARPLDHRTDIFSLGVMLHEMATGRKPFAGNSSAELISSILRDAPASITESRPDLPGDLSRIIRRCLEKDPRHRIQTARDVSNEFRDLARQAMHSVSAPAAGAAATLAGIPAASSATPSYSVSAAKSGKARADEGFWVAVLPFKSSGATPEVAALADGLSEEIVTGLSRFSYLRVIARGSTVSYANKSIDLRVAGQELGARYVMDGTLRQAGAKLRVAVQLIDALTGANLWAETYEREFSPNAIFELQDDLVPRIVSTVADTYGVLPHSMSESLRSKAEDQLTPHEAVIRSFGYHERLTPDEHAQVRRILENAVRQAPDLSDAWAMLSWIYWDERAHGFNGRPDPLGRALAAARRAIDAAPSNHFAHLALAITLFFQKDFLAFPPAAQRAVKLNPMDGSALAWMGISTAYAGDWEVGCAHAESAMRLNPNHPGWYWFPLAYNAYRKGDYRGALGFALKINIPGYFFTHLITAAAYGQLGMKKPAQRAVDELIATRPEIATSAREDLGIWFQSDHVDHVLEGLRKAGLEIAEERSTPSPTPAIQSAPSTAASASPGTPSHTIAASDSGAARADEGFWVAVLPFKSSGASPELAALADGLSEEIVTGLSRFSYLRVIALSSTSRYAQAAVDVRSAGKELGARYVMEGSLRQASSKLRLSVQLVDAVTGAHLWAENYERAFSPDMLFHLQDDLVPRIVSTVADAYGVLPHAMSQIVRSKAVAELTPYEALLRSFSYAERVTPEEHAQAKAALERAVEQHPGSADCWAMLSILLTDEYIHDLGSSPDPLGRAVQAARHAVDAGPGNHKAHLALAWSLLFCREFQASRVAAERTLALNSMDASASAYVGQILAFAGVQDEAWQRGCELITRAIELNPNHPGWYWYAPFLDAYRKHDYNSALDIAFRINMPGFTLTHVAVAAAHGQLGNRESAANAVRQILAIKPAYATVARKELEKIWAPQVVEHLIEGLRKAGLHIEKAVNPAEAPSPASSGARPAAVPPSIAVLPFANLSAERDQEYFSDGLAEEIINLLAQIAGLKVIARTSAFAFRGKEQDIGAIAEALGVTTILQGSVRRSGSRIRVTVQLINSADSAHIWSERYDREMTDVFAVQDEIAGAIAAKLQLKLSASPARYIPHPVAYEEFLKARHHLQRWTPESAARGRECLERAVALDPGFALAHSELGWCFYILAIENQIPPPQAAEFMRATAQRALEIESSLPDAHAVLAIAGVLDYDWAEAGRQFLLAMAGQQVQPFTCYLHGSFYLGSLGRMAEAEEGVQRALLQDPLNALYRSALGSYCLASRRFAQGEAVLRDVLQLNENFWIAQSWMGFSYLLQNRLPEAIAYEEKARSLAPWNPTVIGRLAGMYERIGETVRAQSLLKALGDGTAFGTPGGLICYYSVLADVDSAFDWYLKAIDQRDPRAPWLFPLQFGELFASSPRWPGLTRLMNLKAD